MTFLPIVGRELREAARRADTYWTRLRMPALAIVLAAGFVIADFGSSSQFLGRQTFHVIGGLALLSSLLAGRLFTADCLSSEKREGTLGLLFLTDLKGHDVVLGKLAATSVRALYGLLAVFPVLALPMLMGGITNGEFWRVVLVLVDTFLFSLSIGIFVSAMSRDARRAMAGNFALLLLFVLVLPVCGFLIIYFRGWVSPGPAIGFFFPSPVYTGFFALDAQFKKWSAFFWWSAGVIHAITWLLLLLAGRIVPRTWQDKPALARSGKMRWGEFWRRVSYGHPKYQAPFRKRLLDVNAFYWLAARARLKRAHVWIFLTLAGCWWLWGRLANGEFWLDEAVSITLALIINSTLKLWVALESAQRLAEDQKTGALELLLTTPLTARDIVRGQMLALRRQFLVPTLTVIGVEIVLMLMSFQHSNRSHTEIFIMFAAIMVMLVADMITLAWVGMSKGLMARTLNHAIIQTIARVLVVPWAVFGLVATGANLYSALWSQSGWTPGWSFYLSWWFGLGIVFNLILVRIARGRLLGRFRQIARRRYDPEVSRFVIWARRLKKILSEERTRWVAKPASQTKSRPIAVKRRRKMAVGICAAVMLVIACGGFYYQNSRPKFPAPVAITVDFSKGPLRVFPGVMGAFFILPDGSLWRWGQPGGSTSSKAMVPERVGSGNDWVQLATAYEHCVGLRRDGTIWEWGWRVDGKSSSEPEQADPGHEWMTVAAGQRHALAIKRDGTLWAWGENNANQLGIGTGPNQTNLVQVGTDHQWAAVQGLWASTIAVRTDGTLWAWGQIPRFGGSQISLSSEPSPKQICAETNWVGLTAGTLPVLARTKSGEWWNPYCGAPGPDASAASTCRFIVSNSLSDHVALAFFGGPKIFEVRADGTLWESTYPYPMANWVSAAAGKWQQMGNRSDWISIWGAFNTAYGLTSDGVIWTWGQDPSGEPTMDLSSRLRLLQQQVRSIFGRPVPRTGIPRMLPFQKEPRPLIQLISAGTAQTQR
jgi:alpha-tubulin suppressor-like RCC1 family protein/ABC-type transport system involved in cytochrome c biogenesis permease component